MEVSMMLSSVDTVRGTPTPLISLIAYSIVLACEGHSFDLT